jgi:hypothetical protein
MTVLYDSTVQLTLIHEIAGEYDAHYAALLVQLADEGDEAKAERARMRRERNAFNRANLLLATGYTPIPSGDGWLMPSEAEAGVVYRVRLAEGAWQCSCPAGEQGAACKHAAAAQLIELSWERLTATADAEPPAMELAA